ncbi:hypothetical protein PENSPDRAFT_656971 [Peniophora sp. CONT]|nr:hypothetical protein PENSPDRAFT_656971 [Peniophora sp. CONT]
MAYFAPPPSGHQFNTAFTEMEMDIDMDMDMASGPIITAAAAEQPNIAYTPSPSEITNFIVVDTNVFDHYLDVLAAFVDDVERHRLPITIIIPKIVRQELDWQCHRKEKDALARAASRATRWLANSNKPSWLIREQTAGETLKPAGSSSSFEPSKAGEVRAIHVPLQSVREV